MMGQTQQQLASGAFKQKERILARWNNGDGPLVYLPAGDGRLARAAEWFALRVCWSAGAAKRGEHALKILADSDRIARVTPHHHTVRSDSDPSKNYNVWQKRCKWSCDCPDHQHRKAQCKHMLAVMYHVVEREESLLDMHPVVAHNPDNILFLHDISTYIDDETAPNLGDADLYTVDDKRQSAILMFTLDHTLRLAVTESLHTHGDLALIIEERAVYTAEEFTDITRQGDSPILTGIMVVR